MAIRTHVSEVSHSLSKSLLNRRERFSQPTVRSTIQRHCRTLKPLFRGRFTIVSTRQTLKEPRQMLPECLQQVTDALPDREAPRERTAEVSRYEPRLRRAVMRMWARLERKRAGNPQ
jgi:hypothetical protein